MKTELIIKTESPERKYPYLATNNNNSKAIFVAPNKGIWLEGNRNDQDWAGEEERKFTPLPKGSQIILTQE